MREWTVFTITEEDIIKVAKAYDIQLNDTDYDTVVAYFEEWMNEESGWFEGLADCIRDYNRERLQSENNEEQKQS